MNKIRFLIDEDTPHAIRDGLWRYQPEIEIRVVGGDFAPPLGSKDSEILDENGTQFANCLFFSVFSLGIPQEIILY